MAALQSSENGRPSDTAYGTTTAAWRNCLARLPQLVLKAALSYVKDIFMLLAIYAVSQFLIWLFAVCLQSHGLQYLSPIISMVSLLAACVLLAWIFPALDAWYVYTLQSRVETLNENIGIGFAIPLLQVTSGKFMGVSHLARAVAAFFLTNAVFWPLLFSISYALLAISACQAVQTAKRRFKPVSDASSPPQVVNSCSKASAPDARLVPFFHAMLLLALFSAGIAVRRLSLFILDLSAVLLLWLIATSVQRAIPKGHIMLRALANPVLGTSLGLMLYTHLVATATHVRIDAAVSAFNSGVTPADFLSRLLGISTATSPATPGAGDLAKSILDVGIVIWGFKLYECRTALFSLRGFLTLVVAAVAAVVNMVLAPVLARATRLPTAEALAFAARCVTLALAQPATELVRGDLTANAVVVVTNGILGQVMYPLAWRYCAWLSHGVYGGDRPVKTAAIGAVVGINGLALGVSHLYRENSPAAPYSVLSMAGFGVVTVVLLYSEGMRKTVREAGEGSW